MRILVRRRVWSPRAWHGAGHAMEGHSPRLGMPRLWHTQGPFRDGAHPVCARPARGPSGRLRLWTLQGNLNEEERAMKNFVLRAADRGYDKLVSTGGYASYVAGHPDSFITRHSSFNFGDYQSGRAGFGKVRVFGDETFSHAGCGYNMHPHHCFIIMAFVLQGSLTHVNTIGKVDTLKPGDYYVFSAGSGGKHCELNIEPEDLNVV